MGIEEKLSDKLAVVRERLYKYDHIVESGMINAPEYVIDEMVKEINELRLKAKIMQILAEEINLMNSHWECGCGADLYKDTIIGKWNEITQVSRTCLECKQNHTLLNAEKII